ESAVRLISDLEAAESRIGSGQASPSGVVRVSAAPAFSRLYVVPQLPAFRVRYPKVVVESLVSERTSNLVEEGIDLTIRNGALAHQRSRAASRGCPGQPQYHPGALLAFCGRHTRRNRAANPARS